MIISWPLILAVQNKNYGLQSAKCIQLVSSKYYSMLCLKYQILQYAVQKLIQSDKLIEILQIMTSEKIWKISLVFKKCIWKNIELTYFFPFRVFFQEFVLISVFFNSGKCYRWSFIILLNFEVRYYVWCVFHKKHFFKKNNFNGIFVFKFFLFYFKYFFSFCILFLISFFFERFSLNYYKIAKQNIQETKT